MPRPSRCSGAGSERKDCLNEDTAGSRTLRERSAREAGGLAKLRGTHSADGRSVVDVVEEVQRLRAEAEAVFAVGAGRAEHSARSAASSTAAEAPWSKASARTSRSMSAMSAARRPTSRRSACILTGSRWQLGTDSKAAREA